MTTQELSEKNQRPNCGGQEGVTLIDIITAVGEEKRMVFWIAFISTLLGLGISLLMPNIYTAKTTFLPPQQNQSGAAAALTSLGGLAGLAGGALGVKSPDEMYVAFLQSLTLQDNVISQLKLQTLYEQKTLDDTRKVLKASIKITADKKSGIISIEADNKSPVVAAQLANAHVNELRKLLSHLAVTDAQQRRVFFEKLIVQTKEALSAAELESKKAQEVSGIFSLDAQTASTLKVSAELRAQIALHEVQIRTMSTYATPQNSDVQRLVGELTSLRTQLEKLEQGTGQSQSNPKSVGALANLRAFREVKYQEAILETLIKQYELARVEEAKEGPLVQQIDVATAPERKSKPSRASMSILAAIGGAMLSLMIVFIRRRWRLAISDPAFSENFKTMQRAWRMHNSSK
jgi:tyrosine-protein kinase Etk/Wzc